MQTHIRASIAVTALVVALLAAPLLPRTLPQATAAQKAVRELAAVAPIEVKWNEATGTPDWLDSPLPYALSRAERADPELAARDVLNQYRDIFGIQNAFAEFQLVRIETDSLGQSHVRLQQIKDGLPVFGRVLIVHLGETGVLGINGDFQPGLDLATVPSLTAALAESQALAAADGLSPQVFAPGRLTIYVDDTTHKPFLAWQIFVSARSPSERMAYFVDAHNGAFLHRVPLTATDKYREVYDAKLKDNLPGKLLASEGTLPRDADGAAAYKNAGVVYDYWMKTFGRDSFDGSGGTITLVVHSAELGNSYWDGQELVFGDTDNYSTNKDDALVLDIIGHEFTHAVVQYTADLVYETQSGALNESYADVFAVMVDREDWHLFEDNTASPPVAKPWLRDMQDPSLGDYNPRKPQAGWGQPTLMSEYANLPNDRDGDWGGVHVNSGIPNHVLYLAATASSREAAEQIWYRALTAYLTSKSDFQDFAQAIQKSAKDLYGANSKEANAVNSALAASGIINAAVQPTPVPDTSPKPTVAPVPAQVVTAGCTEMISNGTFEGGRSDPWVERTALNTPIIGGDFPHTGLKSAWLGGTDQESFQYIFQDINIPANLINVTLTYWHYLEPNADSGAPDATFESIMADPDSGNVLASLEEFPSSQGDKQWRSSTLDLSAYAGKKMRLAFTANMVRGNLSNFFVDDVSISACSSATTAPVTGGANVGITGAITDAGTGKGIEGATFYVLTTTTAQASADGKLSGSEIMAQGTSDKKGNFKLDKKLPRGAAYNVIIIASGYKTITADNAFNLTAQDPDPVDLQVKLQKR